jgi:hypothetical protein
MTSVFSLSVTFVMLPDPGQSNETHGLVLIKT